MATFDNNPGRITRSNGFDRDLAFYLFFNPQISNVANTLNNNTIDINNELFDHRNVQFICKVFIDNINYRPHPEYSLYTDYYSVNNKRYAKGQAINAGKRLADWMQFYGYINSNPYLTYGNKSYAGGIHIGNWATTERPSGKAPNIPIFSPNNNPADDPTFFPLETSEPDKVTYVDGATTQYYAVGFTTNKTAIVTDATVAGYNDLTTELSLGNYMRLILQTLKTECDNRNLCYPAYFSMDWENQGPPITWGTDTGQKVIKSGSSEITVFDLVAYNQSATFPRNVGRDSSGSVIFANGSSNPYYRFLGVSENRFNTETVYQEWNDSTGAWENKTMADAYAAAGYPPTSPTNGAYAGYNRDFLRKMKPFFDRMNDYVMYKTCYTHVKEIFPGCVTGNYSNDCATNGTSSNFYPSDARNTYVRVPHESLTIPRKKYFRAEFQNPVCYSPSLSTGYNNTIAAGVGTVNASNVNITDSNAFGNKTSWTPNAAIRAVTIYNSKLYAGGDFTNTYTYLAQFDSSSAGNSWSSIGTFNGSVNSLTTFTYLGTTYLVAAGNFTTINGTTYNRIALWNGTTWSALGTGLDNTAYCLIAIGSNLYVGGDFTNAGGTSASRIAKWNGSSWAALGTGLNSTCRSLSSYSSNALLVAGGDFTTAGGNTANRVASWNIGTSAWSALGTGMDGTVYALMNYTYNATEYLAAGGAFINADGYQVNRIASWDGTRWSGMGCGSREKMGANNTVYAFSKLSNGDLILGGAFNTGETLDESGKAVYETSSVYQVYAHRVAQYHKNSSHFTGFPNNYNLGLSIKSDGKLAYPTIYDNNVFALCVQAISGTDYIFAAGDFTQGYKNSYLDAFDRSWASPWYNLITSTYQKLLRIRVANRSSDTIYSERFSIYRYLNSSTIYNSAVLAYFSLSSDYYDGQPYGTTNRTIWREINKQRVKGCLANNTTTVIPWVEPPYNGRNREWTINFAHEADESDIDNLWQNFYDQGIRTFFIFNDTHAANTAVTPNVPNDINQTSNISNITKTRSQWLAYSINNLVAYKNNAAKYARIIR